MLLSRKFLNRYVDIKDVSSEELAQRLTSAGLEVEGIEPLITGTNLVVGYVLECVAHPDSEHLNVCQVDLGDRVEQIVCGASNVAQGQHVVVAQNGSVLKDMVIKPTQIRGVESNGMICSFNELGVADKFQPEGQKEGIIVLENAVAGGDVAVALGMDDVVLDVSQTPNRSDFLSMFAIAHEIAAIFNREVTLPNFENAANIGEATQLTVDSKTPRCTHFLGKVVGHVEIKESPKWIKEVLMASNIKSINNVVDISNLVMLETGQPLHFYDKDYLKDQTLSVQDGITGTFMALDDNEYEVTANDALIMNGDTPVGIAGVMGLGNSKITDDSKGLVIEVARFDFVSVRQSANRLGLSTESSQRFSKPMDNKSTQNAMDRAVQLLIEYAHASEFEETVSYGSVDTNSVKVSVSFERVNAYLGTKLSDETILDVFKRLNFMPVVNMGRVECTVPSYRKDIEIEEDLIEEVIRIVGYDVLEESLPLMDLTMGYLTPQQRTIRMIEETLLGEGLDQINSYTLVSKEKTEGLNALKNPVALANPMSDKRTHLRTHMFPSMLEVLSYNNAHKNTDLAFFEHSSIYSQDVTELRLSLIGLGNLIANNWTDAHLKFDFFTMKGILLNLFEKMGYGKNRFEFVKQGVEDSYLHPYKSAKILINKKEIGYIGEIHPLVCKEEDLKHAVYCEVNLSLLLSLKSGKIKASPISKFPIVKRDIAVLVDQDIEVSKLIGSIEKASRKYLVDLNVFDVFTSEALGNKKSIAFDLSLSSDRTLELNEINDIMEAISKELSDKHQAEIR